MVDALHTQTSARTDQDDVHGPMAKVRAMLSSKWLALALVIGLLWALSQVAPWPEWKAAFARANPLWLLAAVALIVPHELVRVLRMEYLVPRLSSHRAAHFNIVFSTACVGQLPVGTIGGDVYRICRLDELGVPVAESTAATFIIRVVGFANTLLLAGVSGAIVLGEVWPLIGVFASATILFVLATARDPKAVIRAIRPDAGPDPNGGFLQRLLSRVRRLLAKTLAHAKDVSRKQLAGVLGYSLAMFAVKTAMLWLCLTAIGLNVGVFAAFAALCMGILMCAIPSPAGSVGLRESGIVGVLALLGTPAAPATIGALLFRAVIIIGAGIGVGATTLLPRTRPTLPE